MTVLGFDCANYTVIPSADQVAAFKSLGVKHGVIGTSFGGIATGQLAAWESAGIPCEEYQFPERMKPTHRPWWVDAETPTATRDSIREALRRGARGVYTRRGWFTGNLGAWDIPAEFPGALLWDARYIGSGLHGETGRGGEPCLIVDALRAGGDVKAALERERAQLRPFVPYGGFQKAQITQWHNSVTIYGVNVDLNNVEIVAPEEDDMAVQLVWCPERAQLFEVGSGEPKPILYPAVADELRKVYGAEKVAMSWQALQALGAK